MTIDQAIKILNGAIKKPNTIDGYLGQALTMAIDALKNQPEIIRCKDCVHNDGGNPISDGRYWCMIHNSYMYYCSDGELRGDNNDS